MSARGSAHASLLLSSGTSSASIGWYVAASFVVHVLFFVIVTYLPELAPKKEFVPSVIMVNMVTMSPTGSIGKPGHSGPEKPGPKSEKPLPSQGPRSPRFRNPSQSRPRQSPQSRRFRNPNRYRLHPNPRKYRFRSLKNRRMSYRFPMKSRK